MSELGVFAVDRGIFGHPLFDDGEPYTRREAWLWLLSEASWKERPKSLGGVVVRLSRGQLSHSIRFMATAWRWDKAKVTRFLERLKTEATIETHTETGQTVITICKYNQYQRVSLPTETARETDSETPARQQRDKLEDIQDIQVTPIVPKGMKRAKGYGDESDPLFADFNANVWARRWKKKGHNPLNAYRAFAQLNEAQRTACKASIAGAAQRITAAAQDEKYRPLLATWINRRGWEEDAGSQTSAAEVDWAKWTAAFRVDPANWIPALGPRPGEPGCRVPRQYLVERAA